MNTKTLIWIIGLLCWFSWGNAQGFTVTAAPNGTTPNTLIQQHLAGDGVLLSNGSFTYGANTTTTSSISSNPQIGIFNRGNVTFPINSGIVMTTSNLSNVAQSSSYPSANASVDVTNNTVTPDTRLATIINTTQNPLHDRAALDFDFVAYSDTVAFNYVFASEEYPDFVCSNYNDVFGFFVEGYNPLTYTNSSWNVALLPNGITPVTINTVNGGVSAGSASPCILSNTQYYHQNSSSPPAFNGYTVKLTASTTILACMTYHMHLAISDVGDGVYDSGVFLEEGSFYSPTVQVDEDFQINGNSSTQFGDTLVQNCREVDISFRLPRRVLQGIYHASVDFFGNATVGTDYELTYLNGTNWDILNETNNEVYYHADDSVIKMHLRMLPSATCDNDIKEARLIVTTVFCDDYYYNGHPDAGRVDTLVYYLKCNPPIELEDTTFKYCHHGDHISVNMTSGANDLLWQWIPASGITTPNAQSSAADISSGRTYHVIAKDRYGCLADTADVEVTIYSQPTIDLHINPENGCAPLPVNLKTLNIPDDCDIIWHLTHEDGTDTIFTSNPFNVTLDNPGYYDVSLWLSTAPGCSDSVSLHNAIHVSDYPHAMLSFSPDEANNGEIVYFYDESTGSDIVSYFWSFGDGGTSTSQNAEHAYHVTTSDNMNVRFLVTNVDGCSDDTTFIVPVVDNFALYIPNSFTPNNDNVNDVFQPIATDVAYYRLELYDRQGNLFFMTEDTDTPWDGTINGKPAPSGVYVWTIQYIRYSNLNQTLLRRGTVTLVR